jgi:hypothetical protein
MFNVIAKKNFSCRLSYKLICLHKINYLSSLSKAISIHCNKSIYKILTTPSYKVKESHTVRHKQMGGQVGGVEGRKFADGCRVIFSLRTNSSESEKAWSPFNL